MIERKLKAHYIDCSFEKGLGLWVRIGADLDSYVVDLQPDVETIPNIYGSRTFRHHGYAPQAKVETFYARVNENEEVSGGLAYLFMYLQNMIDKQEYGGAYGLTSVLEVNLWEPAGAEGAYVAYKQYCYVTPYQYGKATDGYQIPFEVSYIGARVKGTFIPKTYNETGEFIPETDGRYGLITKHIIKNATYNAADDNAIGYSQVVVEIPDAPVIVEKEITGNGIYRSADDDANGYDVVSVDVQPDLETRTITANGTYSPTAGNDGFSEVTVDVQPNIEPLEITENGTYDAGDGVDGYAPVTVDIQPKLEALEATRNGRYTPSQGNDGFSVVDINVAGGGSQEAGTLIEKNITANGTYNPQSEYADGYSLVRVNVNPTLLTKTFTENGTYHASSDDADGYATVNVNVDKNPDLEVLEVSENHKTFNPSAGKDGFSQVRVDITSNVQSLTVSQNGEYLPPAGMDGFSKVTVDVDGSGGVITQIEDSLYFSETGSAIVLKEIDITEDGTYSPEEGVNGFSRVNVNTGGEGHLIEKTITENGTYTPSSDDANGYSKVTVNVPNTFGSREEGMVVHNGELVNQTSRMVTENGTYNTTENRQITVNVAGGGGTINLQSKTVTQNGTVTPDAGYDGLSSVVVNVSGGGGNVQGFELYAATFNGGTQNFPQGIFDNKYFVCCFHDNMSNQYTINGVSGNYSATEPGKNIGYIRATTLAVTNQQTTQGEAFLTLKGSVFTSYHNDSGSYISVAGGWVGYPTGGTIYESVATGTTNAITMNSAHSRLLIFFAASNTGLSSVSTIDVNGTTHSVVNMGARYDSVYSLYTAIEINNNSDTTITITMPASCYSYLSIIGI